jgi:hypothetical protein
MNEHMELLKKKFIRLRPSRVKQLVREARSFIMKNPGCADHSTFWVPRGMSTGLSARQVIELASYMAL